MMKNRRFFEKTVIAQAVVAVCLTAAAAQATTDGERHPVNCATAEGDLRAIAAEKKHAQDQQAESIFAITPAGALLGLATGTEQKRLKMLHGDYVKELDQRAAEIKSTCNVE